MVSRQPSVTDWGIPAASSMMEMKKSGIIFSGKLSLHEWESIGRRLLCMADSATWWIADWLLFGESTYLDRYEEAIKRTSLSYQTLRNYAWVARRFDLSRRRDNLSFGHHAEVAALAPAEQDFWLRKAEEHGWSRNRLRAEVRSSMRERESNYPAEPTSLPVRIPSPAIGPAELEGAAPSQAVGTDPVGSVAANLSLHFNKDDFARCVATAQCHGLSVDRWATHVLIAAASSMPTPPSIVSASL